MHKAEKTRVPKPAQPAHTERAFKALMATDPSEVTFIRTRQGWDAHLRNAKADRESPLYAADEEALRSFSESLVFGEKGLAGAQYGLLAERLSFNRFRVLLGLFGIGLGYLADHDDKYCASRGTCRTEFAAVCTSNC